MTRIPIKATIAIAAMLLATASTSFGGAGRLDPTLGINFLDDGGSVKAIEVQPDGKVLIAGNFTIANDTRRDIIRLNADNTIDTTFNAGVATEGNGTILAVKVQPDGKILVGGNFSRFGGPFVNGGPFLRLNPNGSVDPTFTPSGINITFVFDIDLQSSGKVLASCLNLIGSSFIARFQTTGAWDNSFVFPFFGGSGFGIDVGTGDKVIMGGNFTYTVNQTDYHNLARLNPDGGLDPTFKANVLATTFATVDAEEIAGGRVLFWGRFDFVNDLQRRGVAIVNSDGSTFTQFDPTVIQVETIRAAVYQPDGKVVLAGENFTRTNTLLRGNIARLNAGGSVDATFFQGRGANGPVSILKLRGTNRLVIGGDFFRYDRVARKRVAQLML